MEEANICGPRIKKVRLDKSVAQADLSAALEVDFGIHLSQSDISEIERQERSLRDYELDAISQILNVSPLYLLRNDLDAIPRGQEAG